MFDASIRLGYCADSSWVQSLTGSGPNQRDTSGAFDPNDAGQGAFGKVADVPFISTVE